MSEENSNSNIELDKDTKKVRVLLDPSPQIAAKDREIAELNRNIGALLSQDRKEFVHEIEPKKPNTNGESALLYTPEAEKHTFTNVDASTIPLEWVHGKSETEVLSLTKDLADKGNVDAKKAIRTITKRSFRDGLNLEYRGSSIDFNRHELPVNDSMPIEEQERRKKRNAYLRENRCKWADLNGSSEA
jgi:hypothetical protein